MPRMIPSINKAEIIYSCQHSNRNQTKHCRTMKNPPYSIQVVGNFWWFRVYRFLIFTVTNKEINQSKCTQASLGALVGLTKELIASFICLYQAGALLLSFSNLLFFLILGWWLQRKEDFMKKYPQILCRSEMKQFCIHIYDDFSNLCIIPQTLVGIRLNDLYNFFEFKVSISIF